MIKINFLKLKKFLQDLQQLEEFLDLQQLGELLSIKWLNPGENREFCGIFTRPLPRSVAV